MCLGVRWSKKEKDKFLDSIKEEWIEVWKAANITEVIKTSTTKPEWYSVNFFRYKYKNGYNKCEKPEKCISSTSCKEYLPYYHFWYVKKPPSNLRKSAKECGAKLLRCYIRKKDITTVGVQNDLTIIVAREAILPTCPRTFLTPTEKKKFGIIKCA